MSPSSQWTLFIARPGNERRHVVRDPKGEPRLIFGDDDGTRINDHLARYIVESLNAGLDLEDPNPDEGWYLECRGSDEKDRTFSFVTLTLKSGLRSSTQGTTKRIRR